jgi:GT2 family glycosyltransferase
MPGHLADMFIEIGKKAVFEVLLRLAALNISWFGRFDGDAYLQANEDVASKNEDPVRHYLLYGQAERRSLFPQCHSNMHYEASKIASIERLPFVRLYRDLTQLIHSKFSAVQWKNISKIRKSGLFDSHFYLEQNRDVLETGMDPIAHYVMYGHVEGRNPNPEFDTVSYALENGIPLGLKRNPFLHYLESLESADKSGQRHKEGDRPDYSLPFDAHYYFQKYPDLRESGVNPCEHFIAHGVYEGRDAGPLNSGYSAWRRSFVLRSRPLYPSESIRPIKPRILACLVYEGQSEAQVERTLESLTHQDTDFDVTVLGKLADKKYILRVLQQNTDLSWSKSKFTCDFAGLLGSKEIPYEFVCFVSAGDQLLHGAIKALKRAIQANPEALLHYSDEETVNIKERLIRPLFKGGFDPDLLLERDYVGNMLAVSRGLFSRVDIGAANAWLAKRFLVANQFFSCLSANVVNHIPQILYRRISEMVCDEESTATLISKLRDIAGEQVTAIESTGDQKEIAFRVTYKLPDAGNRASIIIPTRNGIELLKPCIESILRKTTHRNFQIIIIDNGSNEPATIDYLRLLSQEHSNIDVIPHNFPFNYSELNNIGAKRADGDFLVFLNNDVEVISADWLVEPLLLFSDGTIQHAGVALGVGGVAAHTFSGWHPDSEEFRPYKHTRRVSAVTGACLVMKRSVFEAAGGFDEENLPVDFNDVDLCLRVSQLGLATLFTPHVALYHFESKTRESHQADPEQAERFEQEVLWMQLRWFDTLTRDPYYSRNYSLGLPGFKLAWPPRRPLVRAALPEVPNLHQYATHSNTERAAEVVRSMGRTPNSLSAIRYPAASRKRGLSVIILNLDKPEFIVPLVDSLADTLAYFQNKGIGFEILIGDTGTTDSKVLETYESAPSFVKVLYGLKYQFSRCNNQVFAQLSQYDTLLFLNNDIAFEGSAATTLFTLQDYLRQNPEAGIVGAQLLFPDRTIQHAGIGVFEAGPLRGFVYHPDARQPELPADQFPLKTWAVTGACLMTRASDFVDVNGFDEGYRTECQDAALCLEIRRRGRWCFVLSPDVIIHYENGTREKGSEDWPDRQRFMRHWGSWIDMELGEMAR